VTNVYPIIWFWTFLLTFLWY